MIAASHDKSPSTSEAPADPGSARNARLAVRNERVLRRNDLAHGPIRFAGDDVQLLVAGLPQLVTMAVGTEVTLDLAYQLMGQGTAAHDIGLSYRVGEGPLGQSRIRKRRDRAADYESGAFSLAVRAPTTGIHEVEFFLQLDGQTVRAAGLRYLATLVVVGPDERPAKYYEQLSH